MIIIFYELHCKKNEVKDFFCKCDQIRKITFTEEILNGKHHFLCRANN